MNLRVFMLYSSFWPLGSRELAGSACDEDRYRILSQSVRSGRSPVVGGRLVVRYRPSRRSWGDRAGVSRATSAGSSGHPLAARCSRAAWVQTVCQRTMTLTMMPRLSSWFSCLRSTPGARAGVATRPRLATPPSNLYVLQITDSQGIKSL